MEHCGRSLEKLSTEEKALASRRQAGSWWSSNLSESTA